MRILVNPLNDVRHAMMESWREDKQPPICVRSEGTEHLPRLFARGPTLELTPGGQETRT